MQTKIKEIIANILYLDSSDEIKTKAGLFTELGISSIDYIDLCFELKREFGKEVGHDDLWPLNKMLLDNNLYANNQWTDKGWQEICEILKLDVKLEKQSIQELYQYFTVDFIERRLQEII